MRRGSRGGRQPATTGGARGLRACGISKSFRGRLVLDDLDLHAPPGEVTILAGPNGAGKTTLLRIFATVLHPDRGTATVDGCDVVRNGGAVRARVGVALVNERSLFWRVSGRENLRLFAATSGVRRRARERRIREVLDALDIDEIADRRVADLSAGQRQRLILARAAIGRPSALLLDEPLRGLDAQGVSSVLTFARRQAEGGHTVLVVAPLVQDLLPLGHRVLRFEDGKLVPADSTPELIG